MKEQSNSADMGNRMPANKKTGTSISRATSILVCLSNGINTVTGIANHCKMGKSTVHRLLKSLQESHLATQDLINRQYYLGPLITKLSSNPKTTHEYLITCAIDEMKYLSDISEETVSLSIMIGIQYIPLYQVLSKHDLRVTGEGTIGGRSPFFGASTKALLVQLGDKELRLAQKNVGIGDVTEATDTDMKDLMAQLKIIKQQGYAVSYGERIPGAVGISVPINNYSCPAALSILGPESRLGPKITGLVDKLKTSAARISNYIR